MLHYQADGCRSMCSTAPSTRFSTAVCITVEETAYTTGLKVANWESEEDVRQTAWRKLNVRKIDSSCIHLYLKVCPLTVIPEAATVIQIL